MSENNDTYTKWQHEREMTRIETQCKRWFIAFLIVLVMLFVTNAAWVIYENSFQDVVITQDADTGLGGGDVAEMSVQDVERADVLYHALKSAATYHAMKDAEEMEEEDMEGSGEGRMSRDGRSYYGRDGSGRSYRRGRDSMGRYTSRDMGRDYSGDYGYSGHYPEWMPPMYPRY